jgi:5'-nucleotidase
MRILVTNDDGIHAPGLDALARIAATLTDDVWVVAPEYDQSGVAHSLSLNDPLRLRRVEDRRFAVRGTPTDCVIMAAQHVMDGPPDLVLSGINRGHNLAEDVTYSGTVAGAIEGALLGLPSIALSQSYPRGHRESVSYDCAETHAPGVIRAVLDAGMARGSLLNVNFPAGDPAAVRGVMATRQGQRPQWLAGVDARNDGRGNPYYWIVYAHGLGEPEEGTDLWAMKHGFVSVTPLKIDMTDHAAIAGLDRALSASRA